MNFGLNSVSDPANSNHVGCIYHGHCLNSIESPFSKYCPLNGTNFQKYKSSETLSKEKEACDIAIANYKSVILQNKSNKGYYERLLEQVQRLRATY